MILGANVTISIRIAFLMIGIIILVAGNDIGNPF